MKSVNYPLGHGHMELQMMQKETTFKDVDMAPAAEASVCFECGLEAGTKYEPSKDQAGTKQGPSRH